MSMFKITYKGQTIREQIKDLKTAERVADIISRDHQLDINEMKITEYCDIDLSMYGF